MVRCFSRICGVASLRRKAWVIVLCLLFLYRAPGAEAAGFDMIQPAPAQCAPSSPGDFDLEEGRFSLVLYPDRGLAEGRAVLWGRLFGPRPVFSLQLHSRALIERLCTVQGRSMRYSRSGNRLDVRLPAGPRRPRRAGIEIRWLVKLGAPSDSGELTPFICEQGAFLPSDLVWHPRGLPGDRARWTMRLEVPPSWKVLGIGDGPKRFMHCGRMCYRYRLDDAVEAMAFTAGPFEVTASTRFDGGRLVALALPGRRGSPLRDQLSGLARVLTFFEHVLGPAPFDDYFLVDMPGSVRGLPGGVPYRAASERDFSLVASPPETLKGPYLEFLASELARCWFGRLVRFRDHLGEALCVYMGMLAVRKFDGRQSFLMSARAKAERYRRASLYRAEARPSAIRGLGENVDRGTYELIARNKAPILLLCLERECCGPKSFMRIVKRFVYHHRDGHPAGWPEFMDVYEKDSGVDLSDFALLYIDGPGLPPDLDERIGTAALPEQSTTGDGGLENGSRGATRARKAVTTLPGKAVAR